MNKTNNLKLRIAFAALFCAVFCSVLFSGAPAIYAVNPPLIVTKTINHPFPSENAFFGESLSTFDNNLLVGGYAGQQAAYVIDPVTGASVTKMTSPDINNGAISFGVNVLQIGQNVVVTDRQADVNGSVRAGSAYIFNGTTGQNLFTIRDPDTQTFGNFGSEVETVAGKLLISARSSSTSYPGTVHIYNPTTATLMSTINNPEPNNGAWGFGHDMEVSGGNVFISAPGARVGTTNPGAIYRYDGTTMTQTLKISSPNPAGDIEFGQVMDISGSKLLVGADSPDSISRRAYLFDADTGALLHTFLNPDLPNNFSTFGDTVALLGNLAVIGERYRDGQEGGMYVFDTNSGDYLGKVPPPGDGIRFPGALLTVGDTLYASSNYETVGGFGDAGAIFAFTAIPEPSQIVGMIVGLGFCIVALRRKSRKA